MSQKSEKGQSFYERHSQRVGRISKTEPWMLAAFAISLLAILTGVAAEIFYGVEKDFPENHPMSSDTASSLGSLLNATAGVGLGALIFGLLFCGYILYKYARFDNSGVAVSSPASASRGTSLSKASATAKASSSTKSSMLPMTDKDVYLGGSLLSGALMIVLVVLMTVFGIKLKRVENSASFRMVTITSTLNGTECVLSQLPSGTVLLVPKSLLTDSMITKWGVTAGNLLAVASSKPADPTFVLVSMASNPVLTPGAAGVAAGSLSLLSMTPDASSLMAGTQPVAYTDAIPSVGIPPGAFRPVPIAMGGSSQGAMSQYIFPSTFKVVAA